ncbi:MAG: hypothetical protein M3R55_04535 [Acidobacteriota bacterium]|nr:hypothetical protein [Acidobacteriota bacterium]
MKASHIVLALALLSAPALAAQATQAPAPADQKAATVDGKWSMNVESPQGAMTIAIVFKSEGKKLTGTLTGPQGETPLEGEFADGKIAFGIAFDSPNGAMQIGFAGALKDDGTLAGMMTGPFGEMPWSAARVKS